MQDAVNIYLSEKMKRNSKDWSMEKMRKFKADHCQPVFDGCIDEIKSRPVEFDESDIEIWMLMDPFDKGAMRYAYAAILNLGTKDEPIYLHSVLKETIFVANKYNSYEFYKDLVEIQTIAAFLASKFSAFSPFAKKLKFIECSLLKLNGKWYSIEEYIEGDFTKWTNNSGSINYDSYEGLLNCFSHWTHQVTKGYLIVNDLQGIAFKNEQFILTDPAISCPSDDKRFSMTNLGEESINEFYESHQCNKMCKILQLEKHEKQILPDRDD